MKEFQIKIKKIKIVGVSFIEISINDLEYTVAITGSINQWYDLHHYDEDNSVFNINMHYDINEKLVVVIINEDSGYGYKFKNIESEYHSPIILN